MATDNACGGCTMCCKVMGVAPLDKPKGEWCPYCKVGLGCSKYDERPSECATFACGWLQSQSRPPRERWSPAMRPDKTKVVLQPTHGDEGFVAMCDPGMPLAWRKPETLLFLQRLSQLGLHVSVDAPPHAYVVRPEGVFRNAAPAELQDDGRRTFKGFVREA